MAINGKRLAVLALAGVGVYWLMSAKAMKQGETATEGGFFVPDVFGFLKASFNNVMSDIGFSAMTLSDNFLSYMIAIEGGKTKPYPRPEGGGYAIGVGHNIQPNEQYLMKGITQEKMKALLVNDLELRMEEISNKLTVQITGAQLEALLDVWFNTGGDHDAMISCINNGDIDGLFAIWRRKTGGFEWNKKRRSIDMAAFSSTEFVWPTTAAQIEAYAASYRPQFGI